MDEVALAGRIRENDGSGPKNTAPEEDVYVGKLSKEWQASEKRGVFLEFDLPILTTWPLLFLFCGLGVTILGDRLLAICSRQARSMQQIGSKDRTGVFGAKARTRRASCPIDAEIPAVKRLLQ